MWQPSRAAHRPLQRVDYRRLRVGIELNHTIIPAHDKWRSANFLTEILAFCEPGGNLQSPLQAL